MKSVKKMINGAGVMIISILLLSGCVSMNATKTTSLINNAKLLVMPPHDVVQNGSPHVVGKGSGKQLQNSIQRELNRVSNYDILLFEPNDKLNHTTQIKRENAISEAKKIGVDYCLLLTLGEFRNAAPMTFRSDFVTLESGGLLDVSTKKEGWSLNRPFLIEKSNLGNHLGLIDNIAKTVAESIVKK